MHFDFDFIFPKLFGLVLAGVWLFFSSRELYLIKYGEIVIGKVVDVANNPDFSSPQNIILTIEFLYDGKKVIIIRSLSGLKSEMPKEIEVYIDKRNVEKSVIKPRSKFAILVGFLVPVIFSVFILISFFRLQRC